MTAKTRYFLTVDWCSKGKRGIFSDSEGNAFPKDTPHTDDEIYGILDMFSLVLSPESTQLSEAELKKYTMWHPLAEYSNRYGYVIKGQAK